MLQSRRIVKKKGLHHVYKKYWVEKRAVLHNPGSLGVRKLQVFTSTYEKHLNENHAGRAHECNPCF